MNWSNIVTRQSYNTDYSELLVVDPGTPETPYRTKVEDILSGVNNDIETVATDLSTHKNNIIWHTSDFWESWKRCHVWKSDLTWDYVTGTISFSADIKLWLPLSGHQLTIPSTASPVYLTTTRDLWIIAITTYPEIIHSIINCSSEWPGTSLLQNVNCIPVAFRIGNTLFSDL